MSSRDFTSESERVLPKVRAAATRATRNVLRVLTRSPFATGRGNGGWSGGGDGGASSDGLAELLASSAPASGLVGVWRDFECYWRRAGALGLAAKARVLVTDKPVWALALYRVGRGARDGRWSGWRRFAAKATYAALHGPVNRWANVALDGHASVASDVWLAIDGGPIVIGPRCSVGEGASLCGGNTLGVGGRGEKRGAPTLGPGVVLAPGAMVVGRVAIGARTVVGPNSVVVTDCAPDACLLGTPAKPMPREGIPAVAPERFTPYVGEGAGTLQ